MANPPAPSEATTVTTAPATPIEGLRPSPGRLPLLDVLRGVAILGTLMTNVWIFTAPGAEWGVLSTAVTDATLGSALADPTPANWAESVFRFLADGKFLSLLTVLFGVGLAIQFDSALRKGLAWPGRYRRRALFLLAEGALHFTLVFAWDVLMGYAVTALLVARLLRRSDRFRKGVFWTAAALHLALMSFLTLVLVAAPDAGEDGPDAGFQQVVDLYAHGGYLDQILFRLENAIALRMEPVLSFGLLLTLFLTGVRLYRAGAFGQDATGRALRAGLLRWGLGLGVPLNVAASLGGPDFFLLGRYVAAPLVALGYLGLIGAVWDRVRNPGPLTAGLTALGRTAMTGYVLQNVLCMLAAYGIGLGLTTRFEGAGPWWVMALWAAVSLLLLLFSSLWLRRFAHGPLEALQKRCIGG